jgi:hypothetical protein
MKFMVYTPGPAWETDAPNLQEAMYEARRYFRLKRGWYIRLITEGEGRDEVGFVCVYNSRDRLVTGASVKRAAGKP